MGRAVRYIDSGAVFIREFFANDAADTTERTLPRERRQFILAGITNAP
jgi:hypothetical protein